MVNFECQFCEYAGNVIDCYPDQLFCPRCHSLQLDENNKNWAESTAKITYRGDSLGFGKRRF